MNFTMLRLFVLVQIQMGPRLVCGRNHFITLLTLPPRRRTYFSLRGASSEG
jgi:hypothetical protein